MQHFQQALAVQAQVELFGVDHHVVKEGIDRGAQDGQGLQAGGVVARLELRGGFRHVALQGDEQVFFRLLQQQLGVDVGIDRAGFFQDVGDALVRGGVGQGFGQAGKSAHGSQALGHLRQARWAQRQHGIHFLGAVALLAQRACQALKNEVQQRGAGVFNLVAKGGHGRGQQGGQL